MTLVLQNKSMKTPRIHYPGRDQCPEQLQQATILNKPQPEKERYAQVAFVMQLLYYLYFRMYMSIHL